MAIKGHAIPQATKDVWLPMLESGTLTQATNRLFRASTSGYCCLGVYAKAKGATFVQPVDEDGEELGGDVRCQIDVDGYTTDINENELLSQPWADTQGISAGVQGFLSHLNDGGQTSLRNDHPLLSLYELHGTVVKKHTLDDPNKLLFQFERHDFAQIAKIIREEL